MFEIMLEATLETVYMVLMTTLFAYSLGLPLGFILVLSDPKGLKPMATLNQGLSLVINFLRSVPFVVLLIIVMSLTRLLVGTTIGANAMIVPLSIAAFPFIARMVEVSLKEVDHGLIEAAKAMGASPSQIMYEVYLKEALPSLLNNLAIALTTILGYSAMAGFVGGGGLGAVAINYGYYRNETQELVLSVLLLVVLVHVFQEIPTRLSKKINRRKI